MSEGYEIFQGFILREMNQSECWKVVLQPELCCGFTCGCETNNKQGDQQEDRRSSVVLFNLLVKVFYVLRGPR